MEIPLQITFRDLAPSAAVEARIRERVAELERFHDRIMHCHVCVQVPHRRHHQGTLFHVHIDLTVPGGTVVVNRAPAAHHAHEDVYVAIRDAFDAARRQLEDVARRQRGATKLHQPPPVARVANPGRRGRRPARCASPARPEDGDFRAPTSRTASRAMSFSETIPTSRPPRVDDRAGGEPD